MIKDFDKILLAILALALILALIAMFTGQGSGLYFFGLTIKPIAPESLKTTENAFMLIIGSLLTLLSENFKNPKS